MINVSRFAILLLSGSLAAQLSPGDIGVTGFSSTDFGVLSGGVHTGYATGGYGGTGTSQAILWDPNNPQSFYIGGFGFIGRAVITGAGTTVYTNLTTSLGTASQLSFDFFGDLIIADAGVDQVRKYHLVTAPVGTVSDITTGTQPWGTTLNCGAFNPTNGDIIIGDQFDLFRIPFGTTTPLPFVSGLGGYTSGIAFDLNGDVIVTVLQANQLIRIDAGGTQTVLASITTPNCVSQDINCDWIVGASGGSVWRVPNAGGTPVLVGNNTTPSTTCSGVAVVGGGVAGSWNAYGSGCMGQFGTVGLQIQGTVATGQVITHVSNNHAPNTLGVGILGLSNTTYSGNPLPFSVDSLLGTVGCFLNASVDATVVGFSGGSSPAQLSFPFAMPPCPIGGLSIYIQHACFEPVPGGVSFSEGVVLLVP